MRLIFSYIRKHLGIFVLSTLFLTMEAMADLLQPTFMSFIVDKGVANADVGGIARYGLIMLAIAATGAVSAVFRNHFASRTSQTIGKELRHDMYSKIQSLSLENIDRLQPASLITRLTNDVTQIQDFINSLMRMMVKAPITCIGAIILIIIQTPKQAPVMLVIVLAVSLLIIGNIKIGYPKFGTVQMKLDGLNRVTREFLSSVRVVKAFRAEEKEKEKFDLSSDNLAYSNVSALRTMALFGPAISLVVNFGIVVLLWLAGNSDSEYIGRIMASVNYMSQVLFAVNMISNVINNAVRAVASAGRINEVLDTVSSQQYPADPVCSIPEGNITFNKVSFAYKDAKNNALNNVDISIKKGETIGIIGPTGSGKTTFVNLIPRFYDVTAGSVLVDGINVNEYDPKILRGAISVVPQKAVLFTGTIAENLRWGREDASLDEMKEAAKIAMASEFIEESENGYDTKLGQGGVNLSGGQKQRLSLARALVRKPKILILDDCTSALDAATEAKVLEGLSKIKDEVTILLISQRISTVKRCDRILCLDNGMVQGYASHDELMRSSETYKAIYDSQIGGGSYGK